jgi:hypothetical protein
VIATVFVAAAVLVSPSRRVRQYTRYHARPAGAALSAYDVSDGEVWVATTASRSSGG